MVGRHRMVALAFVAALGFAGTPPLSQAHYYGDDKDEWDKTRTGVVDNVRIKMHQRLGCGFADPDGLLRGVFWYFDLELVGPNGGRVEIDFGDGSERRLVGAVTEEAPKYQNGAGHAYKATGDPSTAAVYNPVVFVNGQAAWAATNASTDEGPWQVWAVTRNEGQLYLGHDEKRLPPYPWAVKTLTSATGMDLAGLNPSHFVVSNDGSISVHYGRNSFLWDYLGTESSVHVKAEIGIKELKVNQGCSLSPNRAVTVRFGQDWDASAGVGGPASPGSATFNFLVSNGNIDKPVVTETFGGGALGDGRRWHGGLPGGLQENPTEYSAGAKYNVIASYELKASSSTVGIAAISMGEGQPDLSAPYGMPDRSPFRDLGPHVLRYVEFDWSPDIHHWQN